MVASAVVSAVAAAVEAAEADADRGSVVIRVAVSIIRIVSRAVIAAIGTRGRRGTWLIGGLLIVVGAHIAESLRRTVGGNGYRVIHTEREHLFGMNDGGVAAGEQHADDSGGGAGTGADGRALASIVVAACSRADDGADTRGCADADS